MDNNDFQFLCINTKSLWEEVWEKEKIDKDNLEVTDEGISLKKKYTYTYKKIYKGAVNLVDFAVDPCGIIFILEATGKILYFDPNTNYSEYVECIKFDNPKAIAIDSSNIYVVDGNKVKALSKVNYQTRWEIEDVENIKDIAPHTEEAVYILRDNKVYRLDRDGNLAEFITEDLTNPLNISTDKDRFLYVLEESRKILKFSPEGKKVGEFIPLEMIKETEFSGLVVNTHKDFYIGVREGEGVEIYFIKQTESFSACGEYISKSLDSNKEKCQWHKLVLDCEVPQNTQIALAYHISDDENATPPWSEIKPLINPKDVLINPKDALLLNSKGRYIRFKLTLSSTDGVNTPLIRSIKVYFPRLSYLRYLPAVYQEDEASRNFLEQFLSLFETFLWNLEARIGEIARYFDSHATPDEFLSWLSSWLAISIDENWTIKKRRELLKRAPELFKMRGTREGLMEMIKIYLQEPEFVKFLTKLIDKCEKEGTPKESLKGFKDMCQDADEPIIVEQFQLKPTKELGLMETWGRLFGNCPYCFCVLLKPFSVRNEDELNTVRRIVEQEKPAHTKGGVVLLQPWIYLDMHTYLGINTILSKPKFFRLEDAVMSRDTVIAEIEDAGQIDLRARVGIDTILT